jgi:hypothetical protein
MSKCCSVSWAYRYGVAHESESSGNDMYMDLSNNTVGRRIYSNNLALDEVNLAYLAYYYPRKKVNRSSEFTVNYLCYLKY